MEIREVCNTCAYWFKGKDDKGWCLCPKIISKFKTVEKVETTASCSCEFWKLNNLNVAEEK